MYTLIFNGSPRKNGDTAALITMLTEAIPGQVDTIDCYRASISPCVDCRACQTHFACAIQDEMQSVYEQILEADAIVIASPIFYSELTGKTLDVLSRLQPGYYARLRGDTGFLNRPRRGGILLAGGGDVSPNPAIIRSRILLGAMGCTEIAPPAMSLNTNVLPAAQDADAFIAAKALAAYLAQPL